jgi:hypothetical protein
LQFICRKGVDVIIVEFAAASQQAVLDACIRGEDVPFAKLSIDAELFFPEIYSLVTDANTGERAWRQVPLYSEYLVRELFDAPVYIGPSSDWENVPAEFDRERDGD